MKFLYFIKLPLVERDFERYGLRSMLGKGHDVTVLDLNNLFHPGLFNDHSTVRSKQGLSIRVLKNRKELIAEKAAIADSDLIFFLVQSFGLSRSNYSILRMIAETGTPYLIMAPSFFPAVVSQAAHGSLWRSLGDSFARLRDMDPLNSFVARLPRKWLGIPEADYIVYNGKTSQRKNSLVGKKTTFVFAHTMDYDIYMRLMEIRIEPETQAVFIDQFLPYHPDAQAQKGCGKIDADTYYECLRALFDRIESELNLEVVIAGHPRANYPQLGSVFGNRKIHYGDTAALIAKSRLVVAHYSTAIGFAVMFRKPMMILTSHDLSNFHPLRERIYETLSRELGVPLHCLDDPGAIDLSSPPAVDDGLYDRYIANYIKAPGSPPKYLWDTVLDAVSG